MSASATSSRTWANSQPEIITQHLNDYFVHMAQIVERYEGTLGRMDQYAVGDRLVIFFGAPRAHEDDPVRAVHTALDMQAATREHFAALQTRDRHLSLPAAYRHQHRLTSLPATPARPTCARNTPSWATTSTWPPG